MQTLPRKAVPPDLDKSARFLLLSQTAKDASYDETRAPSVPQSQPLNDGRKSEGPQAGNPDQIKGHGLLPTRIDISPVRPTPEVSFPAILDEGAGVVLEIGEGVPTSSRRQLSAFTRPNPRMRILLSGKTPNLCQAIA